MKKTSRNFGDILDATQLRETLTALATNTRGGDSTVRQAVLQCLKDALEDGRQIARRWLEEDGDGSACAKFISRLEDELISVIYDFAQTHVYQVRNPTAGERIAIVAVGGYGRGTLAPGSDIDLLFLLPFKQTAWGESVTEYILYMLWDMGQKVGHATRTIEDCIRLARTDTTIKTSILEARFIWGDMELYSDLKDRFDKQVVKGTGAEFIADKLAERDVRHLKSGESRYLVEPNIKNGKGGQRDLHTLLWIGKYYYRVEKISELVKAGVFTIAEHRRFKKCDEFLWTVRCHLHFLMGRAEERLTFDVQQEMAIRLGYTEHPGVRDVERFMRHYFLIAKEIGDLTRTLCAGLEMQHVKTTGRLSRLVGPFRRLRDRPFKKAPGFVRQLNRLAVEHDKVFRDDPVNLIRMFHLADQRDLLFHPDVIRLARRSLKLVDKNLRKDPEANRLFLEILSPGRQPEAILRRMNEIGILGRFIPDFGRIVSMMQFNMYHHFTVDEHLLRAIGILSDIEKGNLQDEHPLSHEIIQQLENIRVLYMAVLLHDIAKGRPEDHSIAGGKIARKIGPRLGLSAAETETVAWLVEKHLVMSEFAQSRDLNDPKTIQDFADIVQSPEHLKLLLILSVVDIKAVGPGVWNGWKGQLLRTLYYQVLRILDGGQSLISHQDRLDAAQTELNDGLMKDGWSAEEIAPYLERHYPAYWLNVSLSRKRVHAGLVRSAMRENRPLASIANTDAFQDITELSIYAPDHPRLLSIIAGACASAGANIAGATIFTTRDGMALDSIFVNREFSETDDELRRGSRIAETIETTLAGKVRLPDIVASRDGVRDRLKAFRVEPRVMITNNWSDKATVIEVNGIDRSGLLYDLTTALSDLNLNIISAHVATYGERAVDVFYVTDLTGQKVFAKTRQDRIKTTLLALLGKTKRKARKTPEHSNAN
ncbi:MAG: [protein-PII] uridylyltransferase [Rhizobiales bacterium]|nr:[protein-PII] uridylyltransferase [Hyphomicrobiales bacterium]